MQVALLHSSRFVVFKQTVCFLQNQRHILPFYSLYIVGREIICNNNDNRKAKYDRRVQYESQYR